MLSPIAPILITISLVAVGPSLALGQTGPFTIPLDEASSSVTVQVCIPGGCDSDISGVSGYALIALDDGDVPGLIELHDFDFNLTDQINIYIPVLLGSLTATGDNLRLLYAQPGTPFGPEAIEGGAFLFLGVPNNAEGTVTYNAAGTVCALMQGAGLPCADTRDLSQQGTQTGDISGTIEVVDGIATMTINPNVVIPLDPANPDLGTLSVTGTVVGSAAVPDTTPIPTVSDWGMAVMALVLLAAASVAFRRPRVMPTTRVSCRHARVMPTPARRALKCSVWACPRRRQ